MLKDKWANLTILAVLVASAAVSTACGTADLTITSSVDYEHSHQVTISSNLLDKPETTVLTTTKGGDPPHIHTATLTGQNLHDIGAGRVVFIISSRYPADNHTHSFNFLKPKSTR